MKILAMDTSNKALSVAVLEDNQLLAMQTTNVKRNHSDQLMPIIDETLQKAQIQIEDIDRVAVAQGPGSYTGIRIAVTTAKTLAETMDLELVGISSLKLLAANIHHTKALIVPFMDARRGNVFTGIYRWQSDQLITEVADQHLSFEELMQQLNQLGKTVQFVSPDEDSFKTAMENGLRVVFENATASERIPNAYELGILGYQSENLENSFDFVPEYLRVTEAERNWQTSHPNYDESETYVRRINQ